MNLNKLSKAKKVTLILIFGILPFGLMKTDYYFMSPGPPYQWDIVIDRQTGFMFESNNLESLSEKIAYIKDNYEEVSAIAKNAKNFILTNYSEDNFKFSFKKLFDTV